MSRRQLPEVISSTIVEASDGSTFRRTIFKTGGILIDPVQLSAQAKQKLREINQEYGDLFEAARATRIAQEKEIVRKLWDFFINY